MGDELASTFLKLRAQQIEREQDLKILYEAVLGPDRDQYLSTIEAITKSLSILADQSTEVRALFDQPRRLLWGNVSSNPNSTHWAEFNFHLFAVQDRDRMILRDSVAVRLKRKSNGIHEEGPITVWTTESASEEVFLRDYLLATDDEAERLIVGSAQVSCFNRFKVLLDNEVAARVVLDLLTGDDSHYWLVYGLPYHKDM